MKPLLQSISDPEQARKWTAFHAVLGVLSAFTPWGFILFFYTIILFNFFGSIKILKRGNILPFTLLMGYLQGFEILARITKSFPFVPSEYAKYISVAFVGYALYVSPKKSNNIGITLMALISPALLYDFSGSREWPDIVNNFLSPFAIGLGIALWGAYKPSVLMVNRLLRLIWMALVCILVSLVVKTPELSSVDFQLQGNTKTAGGASTNQVSTMLGFGMFLTFFSLYRKQNFSGHRVTDAVIFILFAFQGLLTFSRGGMIVGLLAILILALMPSKEETLQLMNKKGKGVPIIYVVVGFVLLVGVFMAVDEITDGKLTQRYQGETAGTVGGYAEKNLSRFTSGRSEIVENDLKVFQNHPITGGGAGSSPYLRAQYANDAFVAPHIELTRLLSEHGILGIAYFVVLLFVGWEVWLVRNRIPSGEIFMALYIIALLTSFHSAMRTFVTPFLISICGMAYSSNRYT